MSYAGLTRVSINLHEKQFLEIDGWPGHLARRRASRFCPAMTEGNGCACPHRRTNSHVEKHRLVVALQVDVETIDCVAGARLAHRDQRAAPLGRHHFAITIGEARELVHQTSQNPVPCSRVAPAAYRNTQAWIVPPRGVDARQRL